MNTQPDPARPLCVDCDGTLLRTDLLHEAVLLLIKQYPLGVLLLPLWLMRGKTYMKQRIAAHVRINYAVLPCRDEVLALIRDARREGRRVVLATASPQSWARGVADHLGLFDEVLASDAGVNLAGAAKAERLVALFGERGFDYVGDSQADLEVWARAHEAIVVARPGSRLIRAAAACAPVVRQLDAEPESALAYVRAVRVHQWLKNLLVFTPLAAAHQIGSAPRLTDALLSFLAFSLCASAVYVLNDLLDVESDRQHVRKKRRAFAAGTIALWKGAALMPLLLAAACALALMLPGQFAAVLGFYFALTLAYSLRLKRQVIVDVQLLAALYTLRIIAGAAATAVPLSFWLLAFSMFIFFSLAMVKRYSEILVSLQASGDKPAGRGYVAQDLPVLMATGVSAGMASVLVLALYINDPVTALLYPAGKWLWLLPVLLLYWVSRVWMKAHRGQVHDDPVVFAATDWQSLVIAAMFAALVWLATAAGA